MNELRRLIVRHRHVAPLVASVLAGIDAQVTIRDADGSTILDRGGLGLGEQFPIEAEGETLGWVEGGRPARVVAAVLSYAAARERDKRSLANEALERYRELSLIYDLAEALGASDDEAAIGGVIADQLRRLPGTPAPFALVLEPGGGLRAIPGTEVPEGLGGARRHEGIIGAVAAPDATAELVEDPSSDPRATPGERAGGPLLAAPMRIGGRTTGVVGAVAPAGTVLRAADLKVVTAIAALAGPALEQARRHAASLLHRTGREPVTR